MRDSVAGIDVGGTKIAVALGDLDGPVTRLERFPSDAARGPHALVGEAVATIRRMAEETGTRLVAVGIGCAGPLSRKDGLVLSPPNLPGWDEFPVVRLVEDALGVPVLFDNDANAAALGELELGAGRGLRDMVYVTMSTGVGGGIVVDGEIVHGVFDTGGEVGHIIVKPGGHPCGCGLRGCVEAICSGKGIAERTRILIDEGRPTSMVETAGGIDLVTAETVVRAARAGDPLAVEIWDETVFYFAIGMHNILMTLAPEAIVIGGGVAAAGDMLFDPVRRLVLESSKTMMPPEYVRILPAELGGDSGAYGAVILGRRAVRAGDPTESPAP